MTASNPQNHDPSSDNPGSAHGQPSNPQIADHPIRAASSAAERVSNRQPTEYQFDLDGGVTCLDFANSLGGRSGEHLNSYADLIAFAAQSRLLTPEDAAWL